MKIKLRKIFIHFFFSCSNQDVRQTVEIFRTPDQKYAWLCQRMVQFEAAGSVLIFVTRKVTFLHIRQKIVPYAFRWTKWLKKLSVFKIIQSMIKTIFFALARPICILCNSNIVLLLCMGLENNQSVPCHDL